jgi:hypothetical protein
VRINFGFWIFTTFQELPLGLPLNSEKLSLFSDSERSEESKALIIKSFRFFGASLGNFTKLSLGSLMLRITEIDKFQKKNSHS